MSEKTSYSIWELLKVPQPLQQHGLLFGAIPVLADPSMDRDVIELRNPDGQRIRIDLSGRLKG